MRPGSCMQLRVAWPCGFSWQYLTSETIDDLLCCRLGWWTAAVMLLVLEAVTLTTMLLMCGSTSSVEVQSTWQVVIRSMLHFKRVVFA